MLLPFRRRPAPSTPAQSKPSSGPWLPDKPAGSQESRVGPDVKPHVDYNLQPLGVESLQHYIESPPNDERFKVH